jgi:hypothetical protein
MFPRDVALSQEPGPAASLTRWYRGPHPSKVGMRIGKTTWYVPPFRMGPTGAALMVDTVRPHLPASEFPLALAWVMQATPAPTPTWTIYISAQRSPPPSALLRRTSRSNSWVALPSPPRKPQYGTLESLPTAYDFTSREVGWNESSIGRCTTVLTIVVSLVLWTPGVELDRRLKPAPRFPRSHREDWVYDASSYVRTFCTNVYPFTLTVPACRKQIPSHVPGRPGHFQQPRGGPFKMSQRTTWA